MEGEMSTAIQQYDDSLGGLTQWRPPETVLAEAKQAADALTRVISLKKDPVKFNGEVYLEFEDWQTCAKFYGVTAKVEKTAFVQYGNVTGFEATAVAIDRNGVEISRAESLCLNDEENWGMVKKYKWEDELDANGKKIWVPEKNGKKGYYKGKRVPDGEVAKPLFQLKSMAQTRACSKVLRQVFAWIVVLAGYRPTPAEEMTGNEQFDEHDQGDGKKPPVTQPTRTSEKKPAQTTQAATQPATQGEQQPAGDEVSGIIKKATPAANGNLRLEVGEKVVVVPHDKIDGDMVPGKFIKLRGTKRNSANVGDFWVLEGLRELSDVQEGETQPATEGKMDPENAALAEDLFGEKVPAGKEAVQGLVDSGQLKPASQLPATKAGTIGKGRRLRLLGMCNTNKEKNNGFNHDEIHRIIESWPPPIGPIMHIADIPIDLHPQFEKWATGEDDFREYWKD